MRYLVLCTGNRCRSQMAQGILQHLHPETALKTLPKDKPVALYCRSGNRSKNAARILADKGYEVVELGSGFRGWVAAGKKIVKP